MTAQILDCTTVAKDYEERLLKSFSQYPTPTLVTMLTSDDEWSVKYQKFLSADSARVGVLHRPLQPRTEQELIVAMAKAMSHIDVHGVMIFYPLGPAIQLSGYQLANQLSPNKDVEGLHRYHLGALLQDSDPDGIVPCTPRAVVEVLQHAKYEFERKMAVIINRSLVIGKPLRSMLENRGMTVLATFDKTDQRKMEAILPYADLIVTAVPDPGYRLPSQFVRPGSAVIAINPRNIDEEKLREKCSLMTTRKNPIGRLTRKMTLDNLLKCVERYKF